MIFETPRRCHQNIKPLIEAFNLLWIFHATNDTSTLVICAGAIFVDIIVNLFG